MTRIKLILLSMVAVLGISAVASVASAAAAEPLTRYSVEGIGEIKEALEVTATVGTAQLSGFLLKAKIMIECTKNKEVGGLIEPEGKSKGEIVYEGCTLYSIHSIKESLSANCRVTEPIKFKFLDLLIVGKGGLIEDEFKPATGENFVEITVGNAPEKTCLEKGTFPAKGTYTASLGAEGEVLKTLHELVFTSGGSKLTFNGEPASYTNRISLELKDAKSWLVG
jgi:hypothetical protein